MMFQTGSYFSFKMLTILQCIATVVDDETTLIRGSDLWNNYLQLKDMGLIPVWSGTSDFSSKINISLL